MPKPCVCAVMVTYNRLSKSKRCLECILAQTRPPEVILIVDNHSTDGTIRWINEMTQINPVHLLLLSENTGPAGGYAKGFEWAERCGSDWIWAVDNDIYPEPTCLEFLLDEINKDHKVLVYPWTTDEPIGKAANYPRWSGVLIPTQAIREVGVPRSELFWWIEDTEFLQWRLPQEYGIQSKLVYRARCVHDIDVNRQKAPWKYYYEVRNTIWYRLWIQKGAWRRRASRSFIVVSTAVIRPLFGEHHKVKKICFVLLGIFHGIIGRLGKNVDPASSKAKTTEKPL